MKWWKRFSFKCLILIKPTYSSDTILHVPCTKIAHMNWIISWLIYRYYTWYCCYFSGLLIQWKWFSIYFLNYFQPSNLDTVLNLNNNNEWNVGNDMFEENWNDIFMQLMKCVALKKNSTLNYFRSFFFFCLLLFFSHNHIYISLTINAVHFIIHIPLSNTIRYHEWT